MEQYAPGAGKETVEFIKRIHSRAVGFYTCTQMVVGNPLVTGPMLLNCAPFMLARGWSAVWYSHIGTQTDSFPGWGISHTFQVSAVTGEDAVSPEGLFTSTNRWASSTTPRKCLVLLPLVRHGHFPRKTISFFQIALLLILNAHF